MSFTKLKNKSLKVDSPIFIVGMIRSGTTLLQSILNSHPNISIPRETSFFFLLDEYKRKNKVENYSKEEVADFWRWYSQKRRFTYLGLRKENVEQNSQIFKDSKDFKNILDSVMYTNLVENKKNRWGEKTPGHEMYLDKIFEFYPDARVIFMIRDPRSIYASQKNVPWGNQFVSVVVKRWNMSFKWFKRYQYDTRIIFVKYEDLVQTPIKTVKSICNFIDEDFLKEMITNRKKLTKKNKKNNWTSSYENEVNRDIDNKSLLKWKSELSEFEVKIIESLSDSDIFNKYYSAMFGNLKPFERVKFNLIKWNHYLKNII